MENCHTKNNGGLLNPEQTDFPSENLSRCCILTDYLPKVLCVYEGKTMCIRRHTGQRSVQEPLIYLNHVGIMIKLIIRCRAGALFSLRHLTETLPFFCMSVQYFNNGISR